MSNHAGDALITTGLAVCGVSGILEWFDAHSTGIVAISAAIGALCSIAGVLMKRYKYKHDKDEWIDRRVRESNK
mgnify:CR=1 FL=1|tara:strand:- start:3058 stop:3279 length:222 start_codon:yes stop_codon:yes gene_type:complete